MAWPSLRDNNNYFHFEITIYATLPHQEMHLPDKRQKRSISHSPVVREMWTVILWTTCAITRQRLRLLLHHNASVTSVAARSNRRRRCLAGDSADPTSRPTMHNWNCITYLHVRSVFSHLRPSTTNLLALRRWGLWSASKSSEYSSVSGTPQRGLASSSLVWSSMIPVAGMLPIVCREWK